MCALCACAKTKENEDESENYITIGKVCPLTGSLNNYAQGSLETEEKAIEQINKDGGIFIKEANKKLPVRFVMADSCSTKEGAKEAAEKLIEEDKIDLMIVSDTSGEVIPVCEVCEQKGIPCIALNSRNDEWIENGPFDYSFNASYELKSILNPLSALWSANNISSVALMAPENDYGRNIATKVSEFCTDNKITLVDFGRFTEGITDYTTTINLLKNAKVGALLCFMDNSDFEIFYKQTKDNRFYVNMCSLFNNSYLDSEIRTMGKDEGFASGISSGIAWSADFPYNSSIDGTSSQKLAAWWEKTFSSTAPEMLGIKYANCELAIDILKRAQSKDADNIVKAAKETNLDTVVGHISFNDKNQAILPLDICKWTYENGEWKQEIIYKN